MQTDAQWIEDRNWNDPIEMAEQIDLAQMVIDGDLVHIDGDFVSALNDLAQHNQADYRKAYICRAGSEWVIYGPNDRSKADNAIFALIEADRLS